MQQETKDVIIITWKSGIKQVFLKNQKTFDIIIYEFEDIEEVEHCQLILYKEQPKIVHIETKGGGQW